MLAERRGLEAAKNLVTGDILMIGNHANDRCECARFQRLMGRNWEGLAGASIGSEDYMAAGLAILATLPVADQVVGQAPAVDVTRRLHATDSTCSMCRNRRMWLGGVASEK